MSIESGITKIAEALGALAQSGNAIAESINRYCDIAQADETKVVAVPKLNETITKAVAEFEAEHAEHKEKAEETEPVVEEVAEDVEPVVEEAAVEEVEAESDKPISFEEAKTVVIDAVAAKGKPAVAEIFKQLGAKNLPGLEPSQYGELVALCKAA